QCAGDVSVVIKLRLRDGRAHPGPGSEVHDGIEFFSMKQPANVLTISQIDLVDGYVIPNCLDVSAFDGRIIEIVEVIQDSDGVSAAQEPFDQMRSDKSGAACDQDLH